MLIYVSCLSKELLIVHCTAACLIAKPLKSREAKSNPIMIQTLLLFK